MPSSDSPESWIVIRCGCESVDIRVTSRRNRSRKRWSVDSIGESTLITSVRGSRG